jgi:hypothetical protein
MKSFEEIIEDVYPKICNNIYCGASVPKHWEAIVLVALEKLKDYPIQIVQIKSKFENLRMYYDITLEEIPNRLDMISEIDQIIECAERQVRELENQ